MSNNNRHSGQKGRDILLELPKHPFSYSYLISLLKDYRSPRDKISLMIKKGEIIQIKKGFYILSFKYGGEINKKTIANLIYGPSYISLDYALSYWGLIPESVEEVTSVTNKRNKIYNTALGVFSYRYINNNRFYFGFNYIEEGNSSFFIASKEKAICDKIYFEKNLKVKEIEEYLDKNLRIDIEEVFYLDVEVLESITNNYRNKAVYSFYNWVKGNK